MTRYATLGYGTQTKLKVMDASREYFLWIVLPYDQQELSRLITGDLFNPSYEGSLDTICISMK